MRLNDNILINKKWDVDSLVAERDNIPGNETRITNRIKQKVIPELASSYQTNGGKYAFVGLAGVILYYYNNNLIAYLRSYENALFLIYNRHLEVRGALIRKAIDRAYKHSHEVIASPNVWTHGGILDRTSQNFNFCVTVDVLEYYANGLDSYLEMAEVLREQDQKEREVV